MKRAWWIGSCLVLVLVALVVWRGSTQPRARPQPENPLRTAPDTSTAQPPARSAAPDSNQAQRSAGPAASAPSPGQALHEVEALVDQGKIGAARDLAELYLARIPPGPEAARIQSLTGVHPHR